MAGQESSGISQLAKHISTMGNVTNSFKQAAGEHNKNISKVIKDISNVFSSNKTNYNEMISSINTLNTQSQQTASKIENNNSILQQSIQIQQNMLSTLRDIKKSLDDNAAGGKKEGDGDGGGITGWAKKLAGRVFGKYATIAAAGAGALAAGGAGYVAGRGTTVGEPGGNIPGGGVAQFAGTEEQKVELIRKTIKGKESPNSYRNPSFAEGQGSTASGGYQFTDSTWKAQAQKIGVDVQMFPRAMMAPPELQDAVAKNYIKEILVRVKGDVSKVPNVWYTGNPEGNMSPKALTVNRGQTAQTYQSSWLKKYNQNVAAAGLQGDASTVNTTPAAQSGQPNATAQQRPGATPALGGAGGEQGQSSSGGGQVIEDQGREAATRKLPISQKLKGVLQKAADESGGVTVRVKSGGQPAAGQGGARTGSTRHDNGNAADVDLFIGDRQLNPASKADQAIMKKFVAAAHAGGATGIGAGEDYMGGSRIHVGFGQEAIWGAGGKGSNAAGWLQEAVGGAPGRKQYGGGPGGGAGAPGGGQYGGGSGGGTGGMGGESGGMSYREAAMMQRFHGIPMAQTMGGGPMGGPQEMGMGMQPGMGMGANPLAMMGGMIGGGRGAALGGLAGLLLGGLTGAGTMMGPRTERTSMLQQTAVQQSSLEDRSRQAAIRASEESNAAQSQQQAGGQRTQLNSSSSDYNGSNDMRVSDNSFFGDLMRSGLFNEQMKNLQFTA